MTEQDDIKFLESLRDYRPPKKIHPLAELAWGIYQTNEDDLPPDAIEVLRRALSQYDEDLKALTDALCGLSAFMIYISEELGDIENGEKIGTLIHEKGPKYEPLYDRIAQSLENLGHKVKEAYDRFTARDASEDKRAPSLEDKPPEGSIQLKKLKPTAQPPPWVKKK